MLLVASTKVLRSEIRDTGMRIIILTVAFDVGVRCMTALNLTADSKKINEKFTRS